MKDPAAESALFNTLIGAERKDSEEIAEEKSRAIQRIIYAIVKNGIDLKMLAEIIESGEVEQILKNRGDHQGKPSYLSESLIRSMSADERRSVRKLIQKIEASDIIDQLREYAKEIPKNLSHLSHPELEKQGILKRSPFTKDYLLGLGKNGYINVLSNPAFANVANCFTLMLSCGNVISLYSHQGTFMIPEENL